MSITREVARRSAALLATVIVLEATGASALTDRLPTERTRGALVLAQAEPDGVFRGVGVVTAIDAASGALTLDHGEIKGLMPAMEMMYRVKSRALSDGLRKGDRIDFGLDAKSYTILDVKMIERGK